MVSSFKKLFLSLKENMEDRKKSLIITVCFGWLGLHHYLKGNILKGLLYTFTFGLFFVGYYFDCVMGCMEYPDKKQIKLFRWYCVFFFLVYVILTLYIAPFLAILFLLSVLLFFCSYWGNFGFTKLNINYLFPLFLFIAVINIYSSNEKIPYGEWISSSAEVKYYVLYYKNNDYRLYENEDTEEYIKVNYEEKDGILEFKKDDEIVASFIYDSQKNEMCLLDEDKKCSIIYELKKENE